MATAGELFARMDANRKLRSGPKNVAVGGLETYQRRLMAIPKTITGASSAVGVLGFATRKGAKIFQDAAIARAPMGKRGKLKKSIKIKKRPKSRTRYTVTFDVYADRKIAYYAHMVEFGTKSNKVGEGRGGIARRLYGRKPRVRGDIRTGKFFPDIVGGQSAQPFMRPAWENNQNRAHKEVTVQIGKKLDRVEKKLRMIR